MLAIKLAFRNLLGAGLRTWLNVSVLSFAFVVIVFYNGLFEGWNRQGRNDTIAWETGNGQLWHPLYDRYNFFNIQDAHQKISGDIREMINNGTLTPVLVHQAVIYPEGRMMNMLINGIDPDQKILALPSEKLKSNDGEIKVIIGKRTAKAAGLKKGDYVLLRWRDKNGTFDAREVLVAEVFNSNVPTADNSKIWMSLPSLQKITGMNDEATFLVAGKEYKGGNKENWQYKSQDDLLKEFDNVIQTKKISAGIIYILLLCIALLAIFDTQVLSIFRRQREIGTYIALGMTRSQVVKIFTVEGSAHSILAILLGSIYGIPVLTFLHKSGIPMPASADEAGIAITEIIIPFYSIGMILSTILLVIISATIVSYLPARRISGMSPTDAIKGKIQ